MFRCFVFLVVAGCSTLSPVRGQPPQPKIIDQAPESKGNTRPMKLSLSSLVELQAAEGQVDTVVLIGPSRYTGAPLVDAQGNTLQTRTETRTRIVNLNGKQVTQTNTVSVPYTIAKSRSGNTPSSAPQPVPNPPVATSRREVRLEELQAWNLRGERVTQSDLHELLTRPLAAFVVPRPFTDRATIDPTQLLVLRDDALVIYVPRKR